MTTEAVLCPTPRRSSSSSKVRGINPSSISRVRFGKVRGIAFAFLGASPQGRTILLISSTLLNPSFGEVCQAKKVWSHFIYSSIRTLAWIKERQSTGCKDPNGLEEWGDPYNSSNSLSMNSIRSLSFIRQKKNRIPRFFANIYL